MFLRLFFWLFLLANGALLAFRMGLFAPMFPVKTEPRRMENQLNAEKVKLLPPGTVKRPALASAGTAVPPDAASVSASAAVAPEPKGAQRVACTEIGDFTLTEMRRIEQRLVTLSLGERQLRRNVMEVASHIVFIPSQGNKAGADKKAAELRRIGVTNFFIIQDKTPLRWGISLGVFKTDAAAKAHLANLNRKGVRSARIGARSVSTVKVAYQLRQLDPTELQALDKIMENYPEHKKRDCPKR